MLAMDRTLSLTVKDSLFDPDSSDRVAQFRRLPDGKTEYNVCIYVDGADLPFVEEIVYDLHETFSPRTRRVSRSLANPRCKLNIRTWGIFTIRATITTKFGNQLTLSHPLQYGREISSPPPGAIFQPS